MGFEGAGKKVGVEIWRIEKLEPVRVDEKDHGNFHTGDCYIILKTVEKKGRVEMDLFFWLGEECSKDERGAVAYQAVALDDSLGGKPVQHREVQGHESKKFLSVFKKGIRYLEGGIATAFRHVDPNDYKPRLFQVKGKRNVRVAQVKLESKSMNHGDVFILDAGLTIYQWNGAKSNKMEKFKALEMATKIKDEERGGKANLIQVDGGKEEEEFWKLLGGKDGVRSAEEGGKDEDVKKTERKLLKVSDASGKVTITEVAKGRLEKKMLDPDDVFVVDSGSEVFVWVGSGASKDERKKGLEYGQKYLDENNRPNWTPMTRVNEKGETPAFKATFFQWREPRVVSVKEKKESKKEDDVSALFEKRKEATKQMIINTSGTTKVYRVKDMKRVEVEEKRYGEFYAGDSYVVHYSWKVKTKTHHIIYFWQGRQSSTDEKTASALIAKDMDDQLGGDPVQVRVVQGKEPTHFLALFKGKMLVRSGGFASGFKNRGDKDSFDVDGVELFHVRGTDEVNTRAVQVDEKASSLNSGDSFVLVTPEVTYIWYGKGCNDSEKKAAKTVGGYFNSKSSQDVDEGSESEEFWKILGGKADYPSTSTLVNNDYEPRLFQCTTSGGSFKVEEIVDFSQEDLVHEDVMILDTYSEVFVWIGGTATKSERDKALGLALKYVESAGDGRPKETPVYRVTAGSEPPPFTCHFLGWDATKASDFTDPYLKKLGKLGKGSSEEKKEVGMQKVSSSDIGFADPSKKSYSLEELKKNPDGIDPAKKETYLSDDEFKKVFKKTKEEFAKLAKWKRDQEKKKVGLF